MICRWTPTVHLSMGVLDFVSVERPPTNHAKISGTGVWWQWNDGSLLLAKPGVLGKCQETTWCLWMASSYYIRGFKNCLKSHPYLGNGSNLTNMLQTGWNHQLVASISLILLFLAIFLPLSRGTYDKCMFYTFINGLTGMTQHHTGLNFQNMWPLWQWQMRFVFTWWIHIFPETNIY